MKKRATLQSYWQALRSEPPTPAVPVPLESKLKMQHSIYCVWNAPSFLDLWSTVFNQIWIFFVCVCGWYVCIDIHRHFLKNSLFPGGILITHKIDWYFLDHWSFVQNKSHVHWSFEASFCLTFLGGKSFTPQANKTALYSYTREALKKEKLYKPDVSP